MNYMFVLTFIAGIVAGFYFNVAVFRWTIRQDPEAMINGIRTYYNENVPHNDDDDYDDDFNKTMPLYFEQHNDRWQAFHEETGIFVSQGATKLDTIRAAADRYPDTRFIYE